MARHRMRGCKLSRLLAGLLVMLAAISTAWAQSSGGVFVLHPHRIANGGGHAEGGGFAVDGTIAQHDASNVQSGGIFELSGGFHRRAEGVVDGAIFSDGFE